MHKYNLFGYLVESDSIEGGYIGNEGVDISILFVFCAMNKMRYIVDFLPEWEDRSLTNIIPMVYEQIGRPEKRLSSLEKSVSGKRLLLSVSQGEPRIA
jgi:hypothetical protein